MEEIECRIPFPRTQRTAARSTRIGRFLDAKVKSKREVIVDRQMVGHALSGNLRCDRSSNTPSPVAAEVVERETW